MASGIDATKPIAGNALTANVRANFAAAKTEINEFQRFTEDQVTAGGTVNALTANFTEDVVLANGVTVVVEAISANTGAATLNVDSTGAKTILKFNQLALVADDITGAGHFCVFKFNLGSSTWTLLNPGVAPGANELGGNTSAFHLARANHTGSQAQSTITNLTADLTLKAPIASPTFTGTVSGVTKAMVGLGNADNTSDAAKPVSSATQTQLNLKAALASPALTGTPTAPTAAPSTDSTQVATTAFVQSKLGVENLYFIRDEKVDGTDGGTFTSGAWRTRDLNEEKIANISGASLASNQITLPAGTYWVEARAPGRSVSQHKSKLRNITDSSDDIIGSNISAASGGASTTDSFLSGQIVIAGTKTFELQHRCSTTNTVDGFGQKTTFGVVEVYAEIKIWKVA